MQAAAAFPLGIWQHMIQHHSADGKSPVPSPLPQPPEAISHLQLTRQSGKPKVGHFFRSRGEPAGEAFSWRSVAALSNRGILQKHPTLLGLWPTRRICASRFVLSELLSRSRFRCTGPLEIASPRQGQGGRILREQSPGPSRGSLPPPGEGECVVGANSVSGSAFPIAISGCNSALPMDPFTAGG